MRLRDVLPRSLKSLTICLSGDDSLSWNGMGPGDDGEEIAFFKEVEWMVGKLEWRDLKVVKIFGCMEREHMKAQWDAIVANCKHRYGVIVTYY